MKKVTNYLLLFFMSATVLFLTSCGEDGEDILTPSNSSTIDGLQVDGVDTSGVTAEPGQNVIVSVAYTLDESSDVTLAAFVDDSTVVTPLPLSSSSTNPLQTSFTVPESATEDFTVTYEIQDADGGTVSSSNFAVTLNVEVDATTYDAVLLAAPVGQNPGERTSKTFFSATNGETYSVEDVVAGTDIGSADIHFGYYYGATNQASIASPAEYPAQVYDLGASGANWGTLNETVFRSISEADFNDAVTSKDVADLFEIASSAGESGELNGLDVGDAYAFSYTVEGETRFGIFTVTALEAGIESNDSITLSVKVQATEEEDS